MPFFRTFPDNNSLCLTFPCPLNHACTLFHWCRRFSNGLSCWWCSVSPRLIKSLPASPLHPCWFYSDDLQHLQPAFPKSIPYLPTEMIWLGWSPFRTTLSKNGEVVKVKWELINKELKDSSIINVTPYRFLENRSFQTKPISFLDEITDLIDKGNDVGTTDSDIWKHQMPNAQPFEHIPSLDFHSPQLPALLSSSHIFQWHECHHMAGKIRRCDLSPFPYSVCDLPQSTGPC